MTAPINGHTLPLPAEDLRTEVAKGILTASSDEAWTALTDEEREQFLGIADHAIEAHVRGLLARRFRIVTPGCIAPPESEPEAVAMVQAAKAFMASQKRKSGLMGAPARKLIVPGRAH